MRKDLKTFFVTLGYMWGTYLLYKVITVGLLYYFKGLQTKPYYEFIYFLIVIIITLFILRLSKLLFKRSINFKLNSFSLKKQWSIFIVPIIIYCLDAFVIIPNTIHHTFYIVMASIASALGAAIFEEARDRGFGFNGLNLVFKNSKWKPLLIALITSASFATTHYFNLLLPNAPTLNATNQQVVYTFFLGMTSIALYMRTGSLTYSILLHFFNNFSFWTPISDISQSSSWGSILVFYVLIPGIYSFWCLRPSKADLNLKLLSYS